MTFEHTRKYEKPECKYNIGTALKPTADSLLMCKNALLGVVIVN